MTIEISREVETWFADESNKAALSALLDDMLGSCQDIATALGSSVVRTVYSRKEKQGGQPFKTQAKVAKALVKKRADEPGALVSDVEDIIGLTVVVYYPDQIAQVREHLRARHAAWLEFRKDEEVVKDGYHAYHIVVVSNRAEHADCRCEIQIKTMMHDSWAAKMHDLNYKPKGHTDGRLARMMGVFGDALESIEKQSELLRSLIHERWNAELRRLDGARNSLFSQLPRDSTLRAFSAEARAVYEELYTASHAPARDLRPVEARIVSHGRRPGAIQEGTWLALCLAVVSEHERHLELASRRVSQFLTRANEMLERAEVDGGEIWRMPLALSACGDLGGAIATSEYILRNVPRLEVGDRAMVQFNLANFLVEQAVFEPDIHEAAQTRARVEALMTECAYIEAGDPSAFHDLRGMLEVAFSRDPDTVRVAIELIRRGLDEANAADEKIARIYYELHSRVAYRRLLELEAEAPPAEMPPALPRLADLIAVDDGLTGSAAVPADPVRPPAAESYDQADKP